MISRRIASAAALAAAMLATPSPAQAQAQPRLQVEAGKWNVDYGDRRCSLSRRIGGPQSPILTLSSNLGRDEPELIILRDGKEPLPQLPDRVTIVLSPGAAPEQARVRRYSDPSRAVTLQEIPEGFFDRFAAAQTLRIDTQGRTVVQLPLPQAGAAVKALRACNDDLLTSWGIDTAARDALTRQAQQRGGSISSNDYPAEAIQREQTGSVVARFRVDEKGAATDCRVVVSSGSVALDERTCSAITRRFRFDPALGRNGRPTASLAVRTVTWMLPE